MAPSRERTKNKLPDEASAVNRTPAIICELAVACEHPVNSRPTLAPRAVTPAQAARRPVACEDSTSALAVAIGWKADNIYSLRVFRLLTQRGHPLPFVIANSDLLK